MKRKAIGVSLVCAALVSAAVYYWPAPRVLAGAPPAAPMTKEGSQAFRAVVKKTLPAVVSINAKAKREVAAAEPRKRPERPKFDGPITPDNLRKFFEEFSDEFESPNPRIPQGGFGSGVIVTADGFVLTNNHVVAGAETAEVRLQDGRIFDSASIHRDPKTDLAVIKLNTKSVRGPGAAKGDKLPVAELGDSDQVDIGDWVLAMGAPFGLHGTVTAGIISAKGRPLGMNLYEDFLQTDAAINPGNSGGPLVNLDGQIIAINTAIRSNTGSYDGVGFAIPSNMVRDVVDQLVKHGKVRRGYLGIAMENASPELLKKISLNTGVQVTSLTEGDTPARKAGLQPGDIVVKIDGKELDDSKSMQKMIARVPVGKSVVLTVNRDGKVKDVTVTIEEQPAEFGMAARMPRMRQRPPAQVEPIKIEKLGIRVEKLSAETAEQLGLPANQAGLLIKEVVDDSPAARKGISPGAIILQAEQKDVASPEQLQKAVAAVKPDDGVLLKLRLPNGSTKLEVVPTK